jgi:toxin ParE1/3/4
MNRCVMTLKASQDLDEISDYFVSRNIESGEQLLQLFTKKCTKLMQFPSMGKSYAYIRSWLRGVPLQNYIIFYEIIGGDVMALLKIHHQQKRLFVAEK